MTEPKRRGRPPKATVAETATPADTVVVEALRSGVFTTKGKHKVGDVVEVSAAEAAGLLATGFWKD